MLKVFDDNKVELTRGDTARLSVTVTNDIDDTEYNIQNDDVLTLSIKKKVKDDEALVSKTITGHNVFHIEPKDTSYLPFGTYKYDVQLTTADGDVYTVITPSDFKIAEEVTT